MLFESNMAIERPTLSVQPHLFGGDPTAQAWGLLRSRTSERLGEESTILMSFVAWVNSLGPLCEASSTLRVRILREVSKVARRIDASTEAGATSGYGRHVLYEDPARWSLAAIVLRPGQHTELHNHSGWGCAVTVQGVERNRCFVRDASGDMIVSGERNYLPGTGYVFDAADVHQPVGADPHRVTVALHFLVL